MFRVSSDGNTKTVLRVAIAAGGLSELMRTECEITQQMKSPDIVKQVQAMIVGYKNSPICATVQHLEYAGIPILADMDAWYTPQVRGHVWIQMHDALTFLRDNGIVHSDIMPNNVMRDGIKIKLIDLNSARVTGTEREACTATCREYRPPEGFHQHIARPQYDIYSAAILLLELELGVSLLRAPFLWRDPRVSPDEMAYIMTALVEEGRAELGEPWTSMLPSDAQERSIATLESCAKSQILQHTTRFDFDVFT